MAFTGAISGFLSDNSSYCSLEECRRRVVSAIGSGRHGPDHRLCECAIECEIDLGYPRRGGEATFVRRIIAAEGADVIERSRFTAHHPIAGDELGIDRSLGLCLEHRLVKARRQDIDEVDVAGKLVVLLPRYARGDEDSQMTDGFVNRIDDGLSAGADLIDVLVEIRESSRGPAEAG